MSDPLTHRAARSPWLWVVLATLAAIVGGVIGALIGNPATTVAEEIITTGSVAHASFAMATVPISGPAVAHAGVSEGPVVAAVQTGGPSASAGIAPGDVITAMDEEPAQSPTS